MSEIVENNLPDFYLMRHGEKCYDNGKNYYQELDSPIKPNQVEIITQTLIEAKSRGVSPDKIICSPFLRTRQTAQIVSNFYGNIEIEIETRIGEYLGNQRQGKYKYPFAYETHCYFPFWEINIESYKTRINSFWERRPKTCKIMYVTHGLGVKTILSNYNVDYYPDEGHGVSFQNGIFTMF